MTKERGYILPEWAFMIEKDTGFMETYNFEELMETIHLTGPLIDKRLPVAG